VSGVATSTSQLPYWVISYNTTPLYNSNTRLNDGIFKVHRFSVVTPARLHWSDFIFRFYVYGGIFDNPLGYLLSARGTVFGALCTDGSFGYVGTTGVLSASVLDFMVWDGGPPFSGVS
jgi:hypothetical protein